MEPTGRAICFPVGARKTGKSTFLKQRSPRSVIYDFLNTDLMLQLGKRPAPSVQQNRKSVLATLR